MDEPIARHTIETAVPQPPETLVTTSGGTIYRYHGMNDDSLWSCAVWWSYAEQERKGEDILGKQVDNTLSRLCGLSGLARV